MCTAALITVAETRRQPQCPFTEYWIKKAWCICTVGHYSALRKDKILPFETTWMDLENLMLNEISQGQEPCDITHTWDRKLKLIDRQGAGAQRRGWGEDKGTRYTGWEEI